MESHRKNSKRGLGRVFELDVDAGSLRKERCFWRFDQYHLGDGAELAEVVVLLQKRGVVEGVVRSLDRYLGFLHYSASLKHAFGLWS